MKQKPTYKPQVACPSCGNLSAIDYCAKGTEYTWWCDNDDCGKQYAFTINADWSVDSKPTGKLVTRTAVTLIIKPQKEAITVCVKGYKFDGEHNDEYYYTEGTCPVNLFTNGLHTSLGDAEDSHDFFSYVDTVDLKTYYEEV
jgi:hypothetical protein